MEQGTRFAIFTIYLIQWARITANRKTIQLHVVIEWIRFSLFCEIIWFDFYLTHQIAFTLVLYTQLKSKICVWSFVALFSIHLIPYPSLLFDSHTHTQTDSIIMNACAFTSHWRDRYFSNCEFFIRCPSTSLYSSFVVQIIYVCSVACCRQNKMKSKTKSIRFRLVLPFSSTLRSFASLCIMFLIEWLFQLLHQYNTDFFCERIERMKERQITWTEAQTCKQKCPSANECAT